MKPSVHCPICKRKNNGIWVITKVEGHMRKICKDCTQKPSDSPFDLNAVQKNKDRIEAERKAKNAELVRSLKNNTLSTPPDTWRK